MPTVDREAFVRFGSDVSRLVRGFCVTHHLSKEDGLMLLLAATYYWADQCGLTSRLEDLSRIAWGGQRIWEGTDRQEQPLLVVPKKRKLIRPG